MLCEHHIRDHIYADAPFDWFLFCSEPGGEREKIDIINYLVKGFIGSRVGIPAAAPTSARKEGFAIVACKAENKHVSVVNARYDVM